MALQKSLQHKSTDILSYEELRLAKVYDQNDVRKALQENVHAFIVADQRSLRDIRSNDQSYLIPTFAQKNLGRQCDGIFDSYNPSITLEKIRTLQKNIEPYRSNELPNTSNERLKLKLLRYLASRSLTLEPINTREAKIGYNFPLIEDIFLEADPIKCIAILNEFQQNDYFRTQVKDKVNVCYHCSSSYLNFSECCSKCGSLDLTYENLIHHFRCAYIGPESDFKSDHGLNCPKCEKSLKHIGIDYDKPSEIHICNSCQHKSQETSMNAKCVDCGGDNQLDQITTHTIMSYQLTEKGKRTAEALHKKENVYKPKAEQTTQLTNTVVYNLIRKHEVNKAQNDVYELICTLDASIYEGLNETLQNSLVEELAGILKSYLKEGDLISIDDHGNYKLLLISYEESVAKQLEEVIIYNLNKMLNDNAHSNRDVISTSLYPIQEA